MAYWINGVPDHSMTQEACIEAVEKHPWLLGSVPDHLKAQDMYNKEVDIKPHFLVLVPDRLKTKEMCSKAVCKHSWLLKYVPDWFVTQQQLKIWHDDDYYWNDDKLIKWCEGYQKHKAQNAQIKKELMPIIVNQQVSL